MSESSQSEAILMYFSVSHYFVIKSTLALLYFENIKRYQIRCVECENVYVYSV